MKREIDREMKETETERDEKQWKKKRYKRESERATYIKTETETEILDCLITQFISPPSVDYNYSKEIYDWISI